MAAGDTRTVADAEKLLSGLWARANALQRARGFLPAGIRMELAAVQETMVAESRMAVAMEVETAELAARLRALTAESATLRMELESLQQAIAKKNGWTVESEQATAKDAAARQPIDDAGNVGGERGGAVPWGARTGVRTGRNKLRQRTKQRKLANATVLTGRRSNDAHVGMCLLDGAGGRSAELLFTSARSAGPEATTAGWALRALGESTPLREMPAVLLAQFLGAEHPTATRCLAAEAIGLLAEEAQSATHFLASACFADSEPSVRRLAALALRRLGSGVSNDAVTSLADAVCGDVASINSKARRHAAQALASISELDGPALDQLARALQDTRPDVRGNAALALRNVGGGGAVLVESLATVLRDPTNKVRMRRNAAQSLGKLGKAAISATGALAVAAEDQNCDVRRRSIEALGLVGAAATDADAACQCTSASVASAAGSSPVMFVIGVLCEALLRDSDTVVREAAALALMRVDVAMQTLGSTARSYKSIMTLSSALSKDQSAVVRKISAWALGTIEAQALGENQAFAVGFESRLLLFTETLSSDLSPDVRRNAADALGRIGGDLAVAHLTRSMGSDANACVRRHAAKALGLAPALPTLDTTRKGRDDQLVLSVSGCAASLRADSGAMTRKLAADTLGELLTGDVSLPEMKLGIGALTAALSDDTHSKVRKHCAWALANAWPACFANGVAPISLAPVMHQLAEVLGSDSNQRVRSHAAETIGRLGAEAEPAVAALAVTALAVALRDESRRVRVRVATAVGMMGFAAHHAAKELAATCITDSDPGVRGNAVQSLALVVADAPESGDRDRSATAAVSMLGNALGTASLAVGENTLGGTTVTASAVTAVAADVAAHYRERAAVALRMLGAAARPAGAAIASGLKKDENAIVRKHCAWALGSIWARGDGDSNILLLARTLKSDPDPDVRRNATNALGRIGGDAAVGRLTEALASDIDSGVRRHATQALGSIDHLDGPARDQLARALQDACPDVRRNAALALRNAGSGSAVLVESLATALCDPYSKTRRNAAQSLGKLGKAAISATGALAVAAADEDCDVRRCSIEALGLVGAAATDVDATDGSSTGLSDVIVTGVLGGAVLCDGNMAIRRAAALALMRLGNGARPAVAQLRQVAVELAAALSVAVKGDDRNEPNLSNKKLLGTVQCVLAKCVGAAG